MTWEPKQGDVVCYTYYETDGGVSKKNAVFICMYHNRYLLDDKGNYLLLSKIQTPVIYQDHVNEEPEITVGSVWEKDGMLWVATHQQINGCFCLFSPLKNDSYSYIDSVFIKDFIPRPDKIGMAPCLMKYQSDESLFCISSRLFRSNDDALDYYGDGKFWVISWPANNTMWVIVDK